MNENITIIRDPRENYPFKITISGISVCDETYRIERKKSRTYCFEYIYEGEGTVYLDGVSFNPKAGDVYWLPARHDQLYYSSAKNPWKKIWFNARGNLISSLIETFNMTNINHIQSFNSPELFEKILEISNSAGSYMNITNECATIFFELIQKLSLYSNSLNIKTEGTKSEIARGVKDEIDRTSDFNINLDTLSKKFFCSKQHMIKMFKESYELTPYQYLLQRKLHHAKIMLTDTVYSVKDISDFLCFDDPHNFSIFFKKQTGMSPSEYRKSKKS